MKFVNLIAFTSIILVGCGDAKYETFEDCQLNEAGKISRAGKELNNEAASIVFNYCSRYPIQDEIEEQKNKKPKNSYNPKIIYDPNWKIVGKEDGYKDGNRYKIDENNIELIGYRRIFWIKQFSKSQSIDGDSYSLARLEADCSSGTISTLRYLEYKNGEAQGEPTGPWPADIITPGARGADFYSYVCAKK